MFGIQLVKISHTAHPVWTNTNTSKRYIKLKDGTFRETQLWVRMR